MADTLTAIRAWAQAIFFKKTDGKATTRGAQDARAPVILNSTGKLDRSLFGSELDTDGNIVAYYGARYKIGLQPLSGQTVIFSYDDTGAVYIPLTLDGSTITLRPSADATKQFTLDASGNIQALGRLGGAWTALTYTNSGGTTWTDFGGGHQVGQYKKFGDIVLVRGLAKRTAGAGTTIAVLPTGFRPTTYTQFFSSLSDTGSARIDIDTSGNIIEQTGGAGYVTLNGFVFSVL